MPSVSNSVSAKIKPTFYAVMVAAMASVFGFNFGFLLSSKIRFVNILMLEVYDLDNFICTFFLGAVAGAFIGARISRDAGRILPILGSFSIGITGQASALLSPTFSTIFISEFVVGFCFGVYIVAALMYLTEIASKNQRGFFCVLTGLGMALSFELAVIVKNLISYNEIAVTLAMLCFGSVVVTVSYLRLPESPRWLALSGHSDAALSELLSLRSSKSKAAYELAAINECSLSADSSTALFLNNSLFRSELWFLLLVSACFHLSGFAIIPYISMDLIGSYQEAFNYYSATMHYDFSYGLIKSAVAVTIFGAVFSAFLVDKLGRKNLLLVSTTAAACVLIIMYFMTFILSNSINPLFLAGLILVYIFAAAVFIFVFFCVMIPELLPIKGRELGMAVIFVVNFTVVMMEIYFLKNLFEVFNISVFFAVLLLFKTVLFAAVYKILPETKNLYLERIENDLFDGKILSAVGAEER